MEKARKRGHMAKRTLVLICLGVALALLGALLIVLALRNNGLAGSGVRFV